MRQLTGLSSSLTSLAVRPNPEGVTADSLAHLASLEQLQELSLCPLPEACTAPDLQQLLSMPHLTRLQLGASNAAQVEFDAILLGAIRVATAVLLHVSQPDSTRRHIGGMHDCHSAAVGNNKPPAQCSPALLQQAPRRAASS